MKNMTVVLGLVLITSTSLSAFASSEECEAAIVAVAAQSSYYTIEAVKNKELSFEEFSKNRENTNQKAKNLSDAIANAKLVCK